MKILLLILLSLSLIAQSEFTIIGNQNEQSHKFLKIDVIKDKRIKRDTVNNSECYYKNGVITDKSCYIQTGNILVTFGKKTKVDYISYALKHNLKYVKIVNPLYNTVLYEVRDKDIEIIEIVNKLNKTDKTYRSRVEWIKPRYLR